MKSSDDVVPKRKGSVSTLLPIFGLCSLAALTLAGCEGMPEAVDSLKVSLASNFAIGESAGIRGCTKEALVRALKVDGEVGLSEQQVDASGLHLCKVPWGTDSRCVAPLPNVYTEVDVICPFLFNVWELPKDLYGYGESRWLRQKMIAKCKYNDDPRVPAKWCFTDWCVDKPLTCFSSQKAAEAAKPWANAGPRANHTDKSEVKFPPLSMQAQDDPKTSSPSAANKEVEASPALAGRGKLVPSGHQDEVSDDVSDVEEKIPRRNLVPDTDKSSGASAAQVGDVEYPARHQRKAARRSSIQVLQGAHLMHDRGSERM